MKARLALATMVIPSLSALGQVQKPSCPYINAETVSGALQRTARLTMRQQTPDGEVCDFLADEGKTTRRLYVLVRPSETPEHEYARFREVCAAEAHTVNALGNEAWSCPLRHIPNGEAIFGRVRDTVFFVQMSGIPDAATLHDKTSLAAEQVSLNLY